MIEEKYWEISQRKGQNRRNPQFVQGTDNEIRNFDEHEFSPFLVWNLGSHQEYYLRSITVLDN